MCVCVCVCRVRTCYVYVPLRRAEPFWPEWGRVLKRRGGRGSDMADAGGDDLSDDFADALEQQVLGDVVPRGRGSHAFSFHACGVLT